MTKKRSARCRRWSIVHCLLLGWWAFPRGPFYAIWGAWTNYTGGLNVRVSDIIGDDSPHRAAAINLTPRAAQAASS